MASGFGGRGGGGALSGANSTGFGGQSGGGASSGTAIGFGGQGGGGNSHSSGSNDTWFKFM